MKNKKQDIDIVIGIPSYNEFDSISKTVKRIDNGIVKYLSKYNVIIVNADNSPNNKTKKSFLNTDTKSPKKFIHIKASHGHKGSNIKAIFKYFLSTNARAVAILDADLMSNEPEWVNFLLEPILKRGYDHIFPYYNRSKYDGSITNSICYPIVKGMLGYNIRQPIGGEMSFSRKAVYNFMKQRWPINAYRFGIDIFMTISSIFNKMKLGQVYLGVKKHKPSGPKLNDMFVDVVSTIFSMFKKNWGQLLYLIEHNKKINNYSFINKEYKTYNIDKVELNVNKLKKWADSGMKLELPIIKKIIRNDILNKILEKKFINEEEWASIIVDFIYASKKYCSRRLARALRPLYFIRFLSYCRQIDSNNFEYAMDVIENQVKKIISLKSDFIKRCKK